VTAEARAAVAEVPLWYHTIEVAPGVVTPGQFDLRPVADRLPWPDVQGLRCLDVGTFDGFLAFELERRGASEVVATDIGSHEEWDWPHTMRSRGPEYMREVAGLETGRGFEVAKRLLGSSVERVVVSVYDLDPERLGKFDVVVCGSLLLHLRDPLRALEGIRSVCRGSFMSSEEIDGQLTVLQPRRPALRLDGRSDLFQWFIPNAAAHRQMLEAAGFSLERWTRPYSNPFGPGHPPRRGGVRGSAINAARRLLTGGDGVPHQAVLARS
jgi:2-polyprenyl-3-methyl-5-hydroxy-6-metoxy-1,4-benzoquinol methylase